MAEQLVNEFTVNRPIDEAWKVITDVERIAPCLPGAQLQEIEGEIYRGIVKLKLGAIAFNIKGQATFIDRDDAGHRAVIKAEGRDTGGRGNAAAEIVATAESLSPTSTSVTVTTDLQTSGKMAQFGRNVIGDVSKKLMDQFAGNLNSMLDNDAVDDGDDEPAAPAAAPPGGGVDAGSSDAASTDSPATATATATTTTTTTDAPLDARATPSYEAEVTPRVRKIDSPATEPVDLAGVAGPAVLKRVLPILGAIMLLVVLLRRRR